MVKKLDYTNVKNVYLNDSYHGGPISNIDTHCQFGRYKNLPWKSVPSYYLYWVISDDFDDRTKKIVYGYILHRNEDVWHRCPIGQHKGKPWKEVPTDFVNWLADFKPNTISGSTKSIAKYHKQKRIAQETLLRLSKTSPR